MRSINKNKSRSNVGNRSKTHAQFSSLQNQVFIKIFQAYKGSLIGKIALRNYTTNLANYAFLEDELQSAKLPLKNVAKPIIYALCNLLYDLPV